MLEADGAHFVAVAVLAARHAFAAGCVIGAAFACGRILGAGWQWRNGAERFVLQTTLGLGVLGLLFFASGIRGVFRPAVVGWVLVALLLSLAYELGSFRGGARRARRAVVGVLLALVALGPMGFLALYPPTGFDATLYHLPYVKALAASGRLEALEELRYPVFPQLNETLYAATLLVSGDLGAQSLACALAWLTAGILALWSGESPSRGGRSVAAALFLGSPLVVYLSATAYVECGVALFLTAALWSVERWRRDGDRRWLGLAGACAGAAAATKYSGALFGALVLASIVWPAPRRASRRDLAFALACALATAGPWYLRIYLLTGNPVFPFLPGWFGESPWHMAHSSIAVDLSTAGDSPRAFAAALVRLLASPVVLLVSSVAARDAAGSLPPSSPFLVALLPFALCAVTARAEARRLAAIVLLSWWGLVLLGVPASIHYFVPLMPFLALLVTIGGEAALERFRRAPPRGAAIAVAAVIALLPGWLYAAFLQHKWGSVPTDTAGRDRYLAERLPGYEALGWLNRTHPEGYTVYGLGAENLRYYAAGTFLGDWNGPASYRELAPALRDSQTLSRHLRELGADFLLVRGGRTAFELPVDPRFSERFRLVFEDRDARLFELLENRGARAS